MRAVAYIRVSDLSQVEGHSLDAQERLFGELCKSRGWQQVRVYREEGRSAHVESIARRPVFKKLLDDAARGEFDLVVVHTLDRWSRNLKVTLETVSLLAKHDVGLVSITENIDWSNPQGRLFTQMLGAFAEYYSGALSTHVKKGIGERARQGRHLGGIPFGYESCWTEQDGKRERRCDPEHPGGLHHHAQEGPAVSELFRRYASGTATLAQLAAWLNGQGLRTRNMHRLPDAQGKLSSGPRLFTISSVRGILHNPFYAGLVRHREELLPGAQEPLAAREVFDHVQDAMRRNSGRSRTLSPHPQRQYLLKGIIRCGYCGLPMWAQTYKNGHRYYREHRESRGLAQCPSSGGSLPCHLADDQVGKIIEAVELGPRWLEEVLSIIALKDEVERVREDRARVQEKLRRMAKAYIDGLFPDEEYRRQKKLLEMELESLVVPQASAAEEAGKLLLQLPRVWAGATEEERRKLLLSMLEAVYVDARESKAIVAIRPRAPFRPVFQVATTKEGSGIVLLKDEDDPDAFEPVAAQPKGPPTPGGEPLCSWWRRGGVEPPVQKSPVQSVYERSRCVCLASPSSPGIVQRGQPMRSWAPRIGVGVAAPRVASSIPYLRGEVQADVATLGGGQGELSFASYLFATGLARVMAPRLAALSGRSPVEPARPLHPHYSPPSRP